MNASPRTELRYVVTSKTTKAELLAVLRTCEQHLLNEMNTRIALDSELQAAKATVTALKDENTVLRNEVERHASLLRRNVAQQRAGLNTPHIEDITRCCTALGVKSVTATQLRDWLRDNPSR